MRKNHVTTLLLIFILIAGLSLLLYPTFADWWNSMHQSRAIVEYDSTLAEMEPEDYSALFAAAEDYNRRLSREAYPIWFHENVSGYEEALNLSGTGIMGYIQIPNIEVSLPIYHGTDETVLQIAVGHLEWTSLPVGGTGNHCVISGHRGLPSSELFTNIDHLELGDRFYIHVLGQTLEYQVCHIAVVEPTDQKLLTAVEGQDLVTLVTCTPYGINSHRLLVRGIRTGTAGAAEQGGVYVKNEVTNIDPVILAVAALVVIAVAGFIILLLTTGKKQKKEAPDGEEPKE